MHCSKGECQAKHPSSALWGAQLGSRSSPEQKLPGIANGLVGQNAELQPSCPPLGLDCLGILCVFFCNIPDRTEIWKTWCFYWVKLPWGSWDTHSQKFIRAYVNGPDRLKSTCQGCKLNPGSQKFSANFCWNQGSFFHLEHPAWILWHGVSMGRPKTGFWPLLGITFSYVFSLSSRIWYPACSQNTFPASLFCSINLRRTK